MTKNITLAFKDYSCSEETVNVLISKEERDYLLDLEAPLPADFKQRFFDRYNDQGYDLSEEELPAFESWKELNDKEQYAFWRAHALVENSLDQEDFPYFGGGGEVALYVQENNISLSGVIVVDNEGVMRSIGS